MDPNGVHDRSYWRRDHLLLDLLGPGPEGYWDELDIDIDPPDDPLDYRTPEFDDDGDDDGYRPTIGNHPNSLSLRFRINNHNCPWYRFAPRHVPQMFWRPEYEPHCRWVPLVDFRDDWYHDRGIPHEVSTISGDEFMPFKFWMMFVARTWWRSIDNAIVPGNQQLTGGIYNHGRISFFRIMRTRIFWQRNYAIFTLIAERRMIEAMTVEDDLSSGPLAEYIVERIHFIGFSLTGLSWGELRDPFDQLNSLKRFITSDLVRVPFYEYYDSWLAHHPRTRNANWNIIQSSLGNQRFVAAFLNQRLGEGDINQEPFLDKSSWTHEEHACRFIMCVYRLTREYFDSQDLFELNTTEGWRRYFFSQVRTPDMEDQHWFGFALLMLLTKSWQYNQDFPSEGYEERLVPVLYEDYRPRNWILTTTPAISVGMIDTSPFSEWAIQDEDFRQTFDWEAAIESGVVIGSEVKAYEEEESESEMLDDGLFIRVRERRRGRRRH